MPKRISIYKCRLCGERQELPIEADTWGEVSSRLREAANGDEPFANHSLPATITHICATRTHQHGLADLQGIAELEEEAPE